MTIVARDAVSDYFKQSILSDNYTYAARADVLYLGEAVEQAFPTDGNVEIDYDAAVRRNFDLTIQGREQVEQIPNAISGYEMQLARGVRHPDGEEELVSLGIFRIDETDLDDTGDDLSLRVSGQDRSAAASDFKFEAPYVVSQGTLFTTAIEDILRRTYNGPVQFAESSVTTPTLLANEGDDPWEFAQGLAIALGAELFFNADGVPVLRPVPQVSGDVDPYLELVEGENGLLLSAGRTSSRIGRFNRAIVTGDNTENASGVRGVATDDNPNSPTYYYGAYGKVPEFFSNEFVTTSNQASDMAQGLLNAQLGAADAVRFGAMVDPRLDASDAIQVARERIGVNELHLIDQLSVPLGAEESMSGQTRVTQIET